MSQAIAIIGLGRIGANLARNALDRHIRVVGFTRGAPPADLNRDGFAAVRDIRALRDAMSFPRKIFLYVPAGPSVDELLKALRDVLEAGDIVVDGGNSYWGDSIRRGRALAATGIHFVDMGTSGGMAGARNGACFMAGGAREAFDAIEPILATLAVPGGVVHAGPSGAGHFTKLVHNGIEFAMLEAIGEGMALLESFRDELRVAEVLRCWTKGSVIRSWLVELMAEAYAKRGGLEAIPAEIEDTGEVNWLVHDALEMEVPIPAIALAIMQLLASRDDRKDWARAIAAMRHGFGGHPFGRDPAVAGGRKTSRVGEIWREGR